MTTAKPRYQHDCDGCIFLGQHWGDDLYVCFQGGARATVIARHSSRGPDYTSGLEFGKQDLARSQESSLGEATKRAVARGIIPQFAAGDIVEIVKSPLGAKPLAVVVGPDPQEKGRWVIYKYEVFPGVRSFWSEDGAALSYRHRL